MKLLAAHIIIFISITHKRDFYNVCSTITIIVDELDSALFLVVDLKLHAQDRSSTQAFSRSSLRFSINLTLDIIVQYFIVDEFDTIIAITLDREHELGMNLTGPIIDARCTGPRFLSIRSNSTLRLLKLASLYHQMSA
jgi:hypothetical protein